MLQKLLYFSRFRHLNELEEPEKLSAICRTFIQLQVLKIRALLQDTISWT